MYLLYGGNKQVIGKIYTNTKLFKAYSCDACLSMPPLLFNHWVILISRKFFYLFSDQTKILKMFLYNMGGVYIRDREAGFCTDLVNKIVPLKQ